jgi:hypothetical protein
MSNGRKVGSRRDRYAVEKGLDPDRYPQEPLREVILEILCTRPDDPEHGEQVLIRAARDLVERPPGWMDGGTIMYSDHRGILRVEGFTYAEGATGYISKTDPRCPKCGANPRITSDNLGVWLDALLRYSGGEPIKLRVDFRDLDIKRLPT